MNTHTKHTSGKWNIKTPLKHITELNDFEFEIIPSDGSGRICLIERNDSISELANARLIASAPELLEACKALKALSERFKNGDRSGAIMGGISLAMDKALEAIAKAEGKTI
jgi:hypothetical protein